MLASKLAFITGAGSGIGKAACIALAREGAKIIAGDINYENTVKVAEIIGNDNCTPFELDVAKASSLEDVLGKVVKKYGQPPTVVVNCAGITKDNFILKMSESEFDEVIKINLKGTYLVVQMCSKLMVDRNLSGSIVNLASIIGKIGNIGQSNYAASKAGVEMITKSCAMELGKAEKITYIINHEVGSAFAAIQFFPDLYKRPWSKRFRKKLKKCFENALLLDDWDGPRYPDVLDITPRLFTQRTGVSKISLKKKPKSRCLLNPHSVTLDEKKVSVIKL